MELGPDLLNGLHSRLSHGGSLGVSSELVDEFLHMSNFFELLFSLSHSLLGLLLLCFFKLVKITFIVCQFLVLKLDDFINDLIQKVLGVRDNDHCDVEGKDVLLEPDEGN